MNNTYNIKIDKLKQKLLYNNFVKVIKNNKDILEKLNQLIFSSKNINLFEPNRNFELAQRFVLEKNTLLFSKTIINTYYRAIKHDPLVSFKINGNMFIMAWIIVSFPENVIGKTFNELNVNNNHLSDDIYFIAKDFTEKIKLLSDNANLFNDKIFLKDFIVCFNKYSNAFTYFKEWDKTNKLCELITEYNETIKTINQIEQNKKYYDEDKRIQIQLTKTFSDKVFKHILELDNTINRDELDQILKIEHLKEKRLNDVYCHLLTNDIITRKLIYLKLVLNEIMLSFKKLKGNNTNISFGDICDYDMIVRRINNDTFDKNFVLTIGITMKNIINCLESQYAEIITNKKWDELIQKYDNYNNNTSAELFSNILIFIMLEIHQIKESVLDTLSFVSYAQI